MRRRSARRRARSNVVARIGRKSGCRSLGELKRRRSKARIETSTADSTGAACSSKLASKGAPRPTAAGPAVAHALSSATATATNAVLIMATPVVAADDTPNTQSRQENPYAASSTKPFQVRI